MARFAFLDDRRDDATPSGGTLALGIRTARKLAVAVIGGTLLAFGVAMLVLPGPGVIAIGAGLAVLAAEFAWARRLLHRAKREAQALVGRNGPKPD
ncbi:MAG TPA: PGPGW domain-containing protein [Myxococcota bacterium]|nr:PGPGW domain-containing protein [Myxococcota bacterium]